MDIATRQAGQLDQKLNRLVDQIDTNVDVVEAYGWKGVDKLQGEIAFGCSQPKKPLRVDNPKDWGLFCLNPELESVLLNADGLSQSEHIARILSLKNGAAPMAHNINDVWPSLHSRSCRARPRWHCSSSFQWAKALLHQSVFIFLKLSWTSFWWGHKRLNMKKTSAFIWWDLHKPFSSLLEWYMLSSQYHLEGPWYLVEKHRTPPTETEWVDCSIFSAFLIQIYETLGAEWKKWARFQTSSGRFVVRKLQWLGGPFRPSSMR